MIAIQIIGACFIFTLIVLPPLYKNPINQIMSFPPEIRKRVDSLDQYKDIYKDKKNKHISRKIIALLTFTVILGFIAYYSGARTFRQVLIHVFIIFLGINLYDLIILDILLFCNSKKTRIPGTEDMDLEYKSPIHHIKGAFIGLLLGVIVSTLSAISMKILGFI